MAKAAKKTTSTRKAPSEAGLAKKVAELEKRVAELERFVGTRR